MSKTIINKNITTLETIIEIVGENEDKIKIEPVSQPIIEIIGENEDKIKIEPVSQPITENIIDTKPTINIRLILYILIALISIGGTIVIFSVGVWIATSESDHSSVRYQGGIAAIVISSISMLIIIYALIILCSRLISYYYKRYMI